MRLFTNKEKNFSVKIILSKKMGREVWMKIDDIMLEKLGVYFVYHDIYNRYGIHFETFVERWERGILEI